MTEPRIEDTPATRVDVFDADEHFITSADCEIAVQPDWAGWRGVLSAIEPNARLGSGRYRIRTRGGATGMILILARQRVRGEERYPFAGEGPPPAP